MQTPSTPTIWLSEQAVPLAVIVSLLALVMIILWASARNRRRKMNEVRSGTNEETFVESLLVYGFDPQISTTVYRYLQEHQNVHFPIEATDLLDEDLGLDMVDLDETVRDVFQLTRRVYQPGLRHTPLVTVEDLVRFVQASPRMVERAA
jgi:transcriptional regulator of met regulon